MPIIGYNFKNSPDDFVGCYLSIEGDELIITFDFDDKSKEDIESIINHYKENKLFVNSQINEDEVSLFFKIPKKYETDIALFKIGRYSKFSNNLKEILLDTYGSATGNGKYITLSDALFPDLKCKKFWADKLGISVTDLPNGEVMSIPEMDKEYYYNVEDLLKTEIYKQEKITGE